MNIARMLGAGPLIVIDTEVAASHRSKPEYSTFMSSSVAIDDAGVADLAVDVGPRIGSLPYSVTESNAVDRRLAGMPSATSLKRRLVRKASPSPANIRVGSSFSRLKREVPAV